jgi:hypothetical protein
MGIRPVNALAVILAAFSLPWYRGVTKCMTRKEYRGGMGVAIVIVLAEIDGKK